MKNLVKRYLWILISACSIVVVVAVARPLYAQTLMTDEQLRQQALKYYEAKGDHWVEAAMYLMAYIQRDPALMKRFPQHRREIISALDYSIQRAKAPLSARVSCGKCDQADNKSGSSTPSSTLPTPPPISTVHDVAPTTYPLVCRGSRDTYFEMATASSLQRQTEIRIWFEKGKFTMATPDQSAPNLEPGECSWPNRIIEDNEPSILIVDSTLIDPEQLRIGWVDGQILINSPTLSFINSLRNPNSLQIFDVYNDSHGRFVITQIGSASVISE